MLTWSSDPSKYIEHIIEVTEKINFISDTESFDME